MTAGLLSLDRIAGAPISWGVCEADPWGLQLDPWQVLREMAGLGLSATELGPAGYLGQGPIEVSARLAASGLRVVGGFVPVPFHLASPADLAQARDEIEVLAEAGAQVVVFAARSTDGSYDHPVRLNEGEWGQLKECLAGLCQEVRDQGLVPVFHPHVGTAVQYRDTVYRLLDETEVLLCVDTGHLVIGGTDPVELIQFAADRVAHVHLKDVNLALAEQVQSGELTYLQAVQAGMYVPLGQGGIDIAAAVSTLESRGYTGWYVMEQDCALAQEPDPEAGPVQDVAASIAFLTQGQAGAQRTQTMGFVAP